MSEIDDLLAGVLAHFEDVERRRVLSDWLEEQGDLSRAELVRLQCDWEQCDWEGSSEGTLSRWKFAAHAKRIVTAQPELIGPMANIGHGVLLNTGSALLAFLCARLGSRQGDHIFDTGSVWKGAVRQDDGFSFPTTYTVRRRYGNRIYGGMVQDFQANQGSGAKGQFSFEGAVLCDRQLVFVTDKLKGKVAYPGLYVAELGLARIDGTWQVPSSHLTGTFDLEFVKQARQRRV